MSNCSLILPIKGNVCNHQYFWRLVLCMELSERQPFINIEVSIMFLARNTQGDNGAVQQSLIQHGSLEKANKRSFPLELIRIMERKAVDLLLTSSDNKGRDILTFIVSLTEGRSELVRFKKG